ncbi:MAG: hypothetical protein M3Z10_08820 [Gemmatimonadota bacterium]|nr:hypothetical protein [Gemmatimonadota bacterium]
MNVAPGSGMLSIVTSPPIAREILADGGLQPAAGVRVREVHERLVAT